MEPVLMDTVQSALDEIISRNFKTTPMVTIKGSASDEGNSSKTYSINLKGDGKELHIFVKYMPKIDYTPDALAYYKKIYSNEIKFYDQILPVMQQFQQERNAKLPLINVPKFYSSNQSDYEISPVFLEDIRFDGYSLRDSSKEIDDKHTLLSLKAYARYHALSFAMKDQNRKLFDELVEGLDDMMSHAFKWFRMDAMVRGIIEKMKDELDPETDKDILDRLPTLAENLVSFSSTTYDYVDDYAVIGQGDCNCNNLMFQYDKKTGDPVDVKLLDWQFLRLNSPVLDISYFFYSLATKTMLDDLDRYLKYYHNELSNHIKDLGSDPELLYPFDVFMAHWKKYSKFGLSITFMVAKLPLFEAEEAPNIVGNTDVVAIVEGMSKKIRKQDIYNRIMTNLIRHFIERDFL